MQVQFECSDQPGLDRSETDLAVALHAMSVADREQRAVDMHRQIQRGARYQFLVVDIAAVAAWRHRRDDARGWRRRDTHHPEERTQRNLQAPGQAADHPLCIEADMDEARLRKIVRQCTGAGPEHVVAPVVGEPDRLDPHLQRVTGLGAADRNRPGADMRPMLAFDPVVDRAQRRRDRVAGCSPRQLVRRARHAGHRDGVAALDRERGRYCCVEMAPVNGVR